MGQRGQYIPSTSQIHQGSERSTTQKETQEPGVCLHQILSRFLNPVQKYIQKRERGRHRRKGGPKIVSGDGQEDRSLRDETGKFGHSNVERRCTLNLFRKSFFQCSSV